MRFLIGIIIGAALTLLVATAVDAPTNPIISTLTDTWHNVIRATGNRLFRTTPDEASTTSRTMPADAEPAKSAVSSPDPSAPPFATASKSTAAKSTAAAPVDTLATDPRPDREPLPAQPEPKLTDMLDPPFDPSDLALDISTPATPQAPSPGRSEATAAPGAEPTNTRILNDSVAATFSERNALPTPDDDTPASRLPPAERAASDGALTEDVWAPFHSERSARGFARRLAEQTEYPFDVVRQGPGAYQVVFAYDSPAQRDVLLQHIATLTGR